MNFKQWIAEADVGFILNNRPEYDQALHRKQNYKPPKLRRKRTVFGEATKKTKEAAGIFFTDGRSVLLLKRRPPGTMPNTWGLPGGHIENESPQAAAHRESREECGRMTGTKFGVLTSGSWTCFFYKVPKPFRCEISEEHDAWEWIKFDQLKNIHLHPQFKKQMQRYISFVKRHF